jgi:hypothetical protein
MVNFNYAISYILVLHRSDRTIPWCLLDNGVVFGEIMIGFSVGNVLRNSVTIYIDN